MLRLPFGPLESELVRRADRYLLTSELALMLGTSPRQIQIYRLTGLSIWKADQYAVMMNRHPISIWGIDVWMGAINVDDEMLP